MLATTQGIVYDLEKEYRNPKSKLGRLVDEGKYTPIIRGLYETNPNTPGLFISSFYNPSYISFEYALSKYSMIPEGVCMFTLATCEKHKSKLYHTPFGMYYCRDVPKSVFSIGVRKMEVRDYCYWIATPEKALCDRMHTVPPLEKDETIEEFLFDDLRIDDDELLKFDLDLMKRITDNYHCYNVTLLNDYLREVLQ